MSADAAPEPAIQGELHDQALAERELLELLDGIPERQRSLLYLRYVLDHPQHEVARIMGISTPAVKMLQARALRALERRVSARGAVAGGGALPSTDGRRSGE